MRSLSTSAPISAENTIDVSRSADTAPTSARPSAHRNTQKASERTEHALHRRVYRPWGYFESIDVGSRFQVKRLMIKPGAKISLQRHQKRAEHWVVVSGKARVTRNEDTIHLTENESTFIPLGAKHRLENPGTEPLYVIEVQSGGYLGEDDIERFADDYKRT